MLPSQVGPDADPPSRSATATPSRQSQSLPKTTVPIHVPNGEALDTPPPALQVPAAEEGEGSLDAMGRPIPTDELFVKDAFLVFRALCKLSMKPLVTERYVLFSPCLSLTYKESSS